MESNKFDEFFYSNVCHVCKRKTGPLKSCKSCRLYRYCCREHQKAHWPSHRELCRIVRRRISGAKSRDFFGSIRSDDWTNARLRLKRALEFEFDRRLTTSENQLWMFPRACEVCHETEPDKLYDCRLCPSSSFCSESHRLSKDHSVSCNKLRAQYNYYCSRLEGAAGYSIDSALSAPYAVIEKDVFDEAFLHASELEDSVTERSESLSFVFTLFYALRATGTIKDFTSTVKDLTVHVVGATHEFAYLDRKVCELILHWVSNIITIRITFIGPELFEIVCNSQNLCSECTRNSKNIHYNFVRSLYSDYYFSESFVSPSIITIFNCGFHEFSGSNNDTWKDSFPYLILKTPLLFTSYTEKEAYSDFDIFYNSFANKDSIEILKCCESNRFRSHLPLRDWLNLDEFYYKNNFVSIITDKSLANKH